MVGAKQNNQKEYSFSWLRSKLDFFLGPIAFWVLPVLKVRLCELNKQWITASIWKVNFKFKNLEYLITYAEM